MSDHALAAEPDTPPRRAAGAAIARAERAGRIGADGVHRPSGMPHGPAASASAERRNRRFVPVHTSLDLGRGSDEAYRRISLSSTGRRAASHDPGSARGSTSGENARSRRCAS